MIFVSILVPLVCQNAISCQLFDHSTTTSSHHLIHSLCWWSLPTWTSFHTTSNPSLLFTWKTHAKVPSNSSQLSISIHFIFAGANHGKNQQAKRYQLIYNCSITNAEFKISTKNVIRWSNSQYCLLLETVSEFHNAHHYSVELIQSCLRGTDTTFSIGNKQTTYCKNVIQGKYQAQIRNITASAALKTL